jgi:hypothetical protein
MRTGDAKLKDVSWKRVVLGFGATMLSLYTLSFVLGASVGTASIVWMFVFVILSNAIWWGIILYPRSSVRA